MSELKEIIKRNGLSNLKKGDKVYKVLHQKGSWDIFAIQDRVNKYYVTTVKTIEQAKSYILYNLGERK